jgi:uncharacterized membrane protein YeaQ/YmgE (transglycosylase-associated protein family)
MDFGMFATWIVVGLLTGWIMRGLVTQGSHGRVGDTILGLVGSGAMSSVAAGLGDVVQTGRPAMAAAALVGAAFLIVLQRKVWPSGTAPNA